MADFKKTVDAASPFATRFASDAFGDLTKLAKIGDLIDLTGLDPAFLQRIIAALNAQGISQEETLRALKAIAIRIDEARTGDKISRDNLKKIGFKLEDFEPTDFDGAIRDILAKLAVDNKGKSRSTSAVRNLTTPILGNIDQPFVQAIAKSGAGLEQLGANRLPVPFTQEDISAAQIMVEARERFDLGKLFPGELVVKANTALLQVGGVFENLSGFNKQNLTQKQKNRNERLDVPPLTLSTDPKVLSVRLDDLEERVLENQRRFAESRGDKTNEILSALEAVILRDIKRDEDALRETNNRLLILEANSSRFASPRTPKENTEPTLILKPQAIAAPAAPALSSEELAARLDAEFGDFDAAFSALRERITTGFKMTLDDLVGIIGVTLEEIAEAAAEVGLDLKVKPAARKSRARQGKKAPGLGPTLVDSQGRRPTLSLSAVMGGGTGTGAPGGPGQALGFGDLTEALRLVTGEAGRAGNVLQGMLQSASTGAGDLTGLLGGVFDALGGIGGKAGQLIGLFANLFSGGSLGGLLGGLGGILGFAGGGTVQPDIPALVGERN